MSKAETRLQVLCVAMQQADLFLAEKMNIQSDIIIANQADRTGFQKEEHSWGTVQMITTATRGVGKNRNIAFIHASGEILLLSDDDMCYSDTYATDIVDEFDAHPDADVIIFNIQSSDLKRPQKQNSVTKKLTALSRLPYGAPRIAIRRDSWERSNVWFTTLFGGGAPYTNGEDSMFLAEIRKHGLTMYVSNKSIGTVNMDNSSWFGGANEEFYFTKGALCEAVYPRSVYLRMVYFMLRLKSPLRYFDRLRWFKCGMDAYRKGITYKELK